MIMRLIRSRLANFLVVLVITFLIFTCSTSTISKTDSKESPSAAIKNFLSNSIVKQKGCLTCHSVAGSGGTVGPGLDQVANRRTAEWLKRWLEDPPGIKPDTFMPNFNLPADQVEALAAFVTSQTGQKNEEVKKWEENIIFYLDSRPREIGEMVYRRFGCDGCHGQGGDGGYKNANAVPDEKIPMLKRSTRNLSKEEIKYILFTGSKPEKIEGYVTFKGDSPKIEKLKVTSDHQFCGTDKYSEEFIVSENNKGLKNVVFRLVLLGGQPHIKTMRATDITLEQRGCVYVPHVQVTSVGAKLNIVNNDPLFHNVHAKQVIDEFEKNTIFNIPQIPGSDLAKQSKSLDKEGIFEFVCDVHSWMKSYIIVHENNHYAITDENGYFTIEKIPPGVHKLLIWHEAFGESEKSVIVSTGKTITLNIPIEPNE